MRKVLGIEWKLPDGAQLVCRSHLECQAAPSRSLLLEADVEEKFEEGEES